MRVRLLGGPNDGEHMSVETTVRTLKVPSPPTPLTLRPRAPDATPLSHYEEYEVRGSVAVHSSTRLCDGCRRAR